MPGIDQLRLIGPADAGARRLLARFPFIEFTSGRRNVAEQADAMASNIVARRDWILRTYSDTAERAALQGWVDSHPDAIRRPEIARGLARVMANWDDGQKGRLSKHFSGQAFDVRPLVNSPAASAIKAEIRALDGLVKFLEKEGGLVRWHAQFA
ncbi:M15 family metallopeptidase domain-containing protein [Sandaracinobacteroides saxicola]|uniref:Uncharacterized protein n=1 Tax=Sandaracinobacteroides saxicola TaxID=2759707 RepID=A0A7G5IEL2_9SPHN|nr:hypothetical protein [Sandaracinobacteroides saxicola]QMW21804.1 hypothetical protein H3309_10395 [Sandaracinobacteroides saxicola]